MKLLAFDTTTEACSVAVYQDGFIDCDYRIAKNQQAEILLEMINGLLEKHQLSITDLDLLAFSNGPGSFTGIRLASGVIQALAFATQLLVVPISSLKAIAYTACQQYQCQHILAGIDARMNEIYLGAYAVVNNNIITVLDEQLCSPLDLPALTDHHYFAVGSAWKSYADCLKVHYPDRLHGVDSSLFPRADSIAMLAVHAYKTGSAIPIEHCVPNYLRNQVTHQSISRRKKWIKNS